jgi:hypothetical protein
MFIWLALTVLAQLPTTTMTMTVYNIVPYVGGGGQVKTLFAGGYRFTMCSAPIEFSSNHS